MKGCLAVFFAACVHSVSVPTGVQDSGETLWIGVNGSVPDGMASLHFVDAVTEPNGAVCHSPDRRGPLWQQLDQGALRVVCTANANHLSRRDRLQQRYQVPVALAPSDVEHLIVAVPERTRHGAVLYEDLITVADPLALRVDVQRGDHTDLRLPDGAWGVLHVVVGPEHPVIVQQAAGGLTVRVDAGEHLEWTTLGGWARLD